MKRLIIFGLIIALCVIAGPAMAVELQTVDCPTGLNSCTANEVQTTQVGNAVILENKCAVDGTIHLAITANFDANADRYDLGMFVAKDGGTLSDGPTALECAGGYAPIPPFANLDSITDTCGDIDNAFVPVTSTFEVWVDCDSIIDGSLESCRFWAQPGANVECTGSPGPSAGTGSNCDCTAFTVELPPDPCAEADCDDEVDCTEDSCTVDQAGAPVCSNTPDNSACDDQDVCTTDSCDAETGCAHDPIPGCGTPVPEFPTLALPAAMIIGFLGVVLLIQGTKKQ